MKNGERTIKKLTKNGSKNILIHSLYGTTNWIVSEKTEPSLWKITLFNPTKNITYNIGTTNNKQHKKVWSALTSYETEKITSQIKIVQELKTLIKNYKNNKQYQHTVKIPIPNTKFSIIGKQNSDETWTTYVHETSTGKEIKLETTMTTMEFVMLTNITNKTTFTDKITTEIIEKFINKTIKQINKKHENKRKTHTNRKSQAI
jgi:hypothetical protein